MNDSKTIEITPELNRRIQAERRLEPRERMANLEKRLSKIKSRVEGRTSLTGYEIMELYRIAAGIDE